MGIRIALGMLWGWFGDALGTLHFGDGWGCSGDGPTSPTTECPADWGNVLDYNAEPRSLDMGVGSPSAPARPISSCDHLSDSFI